MMMNRLGVKEYNYESFMTDIYNRCNNLGLRPESISYYLTNLLEFSNSVPFSKIPDYIDQKTREKKKLEEEIERLKEQKEDFEGQKSVAEELRGIALKDEKMTAANLKWYSDLKEELRKYGIPVDDASQLAKVVNGISKYGYDIQKVIDEFSNLQLLKIQFKSYKENITNLKQQYDALSKDFSFLQ